MRRPGEPLRQIVLADARVLIEASRDRLQELNDNIGRELWNVEVFEWPTLGDMVDWAEEMGTITRIAVGLIGEENGDHGTEEAPK